MSLKEYKDKRNFLKTLEPDGSQKAPKDQKRQAGGGLIYAIQKHKASRLHYDLRLEEDGVLKSWAIPKEPPTEQGVRRLAVRTEDHPLGYEDFEGVIPEGEYGAGRVEIWDRGAYHIIEHSPAKRVIEIHGRKLRGRYVLIKLKPQKAGDDNWLFFKLKNSL